MKKINIPPQIIAYVTGFLIIIWVVYLLLKRIGLIESRQQRVEEKEQTEREKRAVQFFPPNIWKEYPTRTAMNNDVSNNLATEINNSFGFFNDNEQRIFSVFQKLAYKQNVSQLSNSYEQLFHADLHSKLFDNLNSNEMDYIYNIIDIKPTK